MISVSIRVLGREPWSSIATNLLFIASFLKAPGPCLIWGRSGGLTGLPEKNRHSPKKAGLFSREWRAESSMSAARRPACHTVVLGSRTLRPSRWSDVNNGVLESSPPPKFGEVLSTAAFVDSWKPAEWWVSRPTHQRPNRVLLCSQGKAERASANKKAAALTTLSDVQKNDLREAFELFDTDGSGTLRI